MSVFESIFDILFPPRKTELLVRKSALNELSALLSPTPIELPSISIVSLLSYKTPLVQATILEAKFHKNTRAQRMLGYALREYLLETVFEEAGLGTNITLVPIPLSPARRRERGYNQVEQLCEIALQDTKEITLDSTILTRTRNTPPQTTLARKQRLQNMYGAFSSLPLDTSATYIVLDDVTTTGATLREAVRALRESGAQHILPIALAH